MNKTISSKAISTKKVAATDKLSQNILSTFKIHFSSNYQSYSYWKPNYPDFSPEPSFSKN